jgi:hypothetical protein
VAGAAAQRIGFDAQAVQHRGEQISQRLITFNPISPSDE